MKTESNGRQELRAAATETLQELTRLIVAAPPKIAGMLIYIRDHLFDRQLSVTRIKEHCHVRDNSVAIYFHAEVGEPPAAFITTHRLAVVDRLLADTGLPLWKISQLVGYSSIQVFSRAYLRRKGRRPKAFRLQTRNEQPTLPAPSLAPAQQPDLLAQALAGQLEPPEAADLIRRLLEIYPPGRHQASAR